MKFGDHWRQAGLAWFVVLLLNPLYLAGEDVKRQNLNGEEVRAIETGGSFVLKNVQVEPVPLMTASSERYQVFWTMEGVAREEEEGGLTTGLTGEPSIPVAFSLSQN